ncbi:MAG: Na+/H+ antiporter subunit E [Planctomycetota bacterium]
MGRGLGLALMLAVYWAVLSFELRSPLLVGFGVVCIAVVTGVCVRHRILVEDWSPLRLLASARYLPYLLWEVLLANLRVLKVVYSPEMPLDPQVVKVPTELRTPTARMIYANSITMTPGTVTLETGPVYLVHALTHEDARGLVEGDMQERVRALEPRA